MVGRELTGDFNQVEWIINASKMSITNLPDWLATTVWLEKNQLAIFCDFFDTLSCLDSRCPQIVTFFVRDSKDRRKIAIWRETVGAVRLITPHPIERQRVLCHSWAFIRRSYICCKETTQKRDKKHDWLHFLPCLLLCYTTLLVTVNCFVKVSIG